jgi:hypothetical protein
LRAIARIPESHQSNNSGEHLVSGEEKFIHSYLLVIVDFHCSAEVLRSRAPGEERSRLQLLRNLSRNFPAWSGGLEYISWATERRDNSGKAIFFS